MHARLQGCLRSIHLGILLKQTGSLVEYIIHLWVVNSMLNYFFECFTIAYTIKCFRKEVPFAQAHKDLRTNTYYFHINKRRDAQTFGKPIICKIQ